jgi:hypothetical protein
MTDRIAFSYPNNLRKGGGGYRLWKGSILGSKSVTLKIMSCSSPFWQTQRHIGPTYCPRSGQLEHGLYLAETVKQQSS